MNFRCSHLCVSPFVLYNYLVLLPAGYIFDGEYHYYHHAYLTVNYAELEFLDKMFGTHHSQQERFAKKASA